MRKFSFKVNERGVRAHEKKSPVGSFLSSGNGIKSGIPGAFFEQEEKPEKSGTLALRGKCPTNSSSGTVRCGEPDRCSPA